MERIMIAFEKIAVCLGFKFFYLRKLIKNSNFKKSRKIKSATN